MTVAMPESSAGAIAEAARLLRQAAADRRPCSPVRDVLGAGDIAAAYAVQEANTKIRLAEGNRIVGRKVGLTAKAAQQAFNIDQPDSGMLFADMEIPDRDEVPAGLLLQPRVEGEIAFVLHRDLTHERPSVAGIIQAIDFVLPAIEVVDSRIQNWDIQAVDTVADNASSGLYVLGATPRSLRGLDLQLCGMTLEKNGEAVAFGTGLACLGHPLQAVRWLAAAMVRAGRPLAAGDVVLSGALGPSVPVSGGNNVEVRISGVGGAAVSFAREESRQ